ncbi:MAG: DNA polymerase I [Clostridia bacterium]|nr:DNA polymerase I [Clostridia bacterium]
MKKLALIDGNSLFNRAFYATPVFSTASGQPTNAIFGFVKLLFKIIQDREPDYIICAFDLKAPTFRHKMYDDYKGTRHAMPDSLQVQVPLLKDLLRAMKIAIREQEGIEADDILGTISRKLGGEAHSYIYTGDRDSFQLVDESTDICFTVKGVSELKELNVANFKDETGLDSPGQVIDLKSLMGDTSDNIPGVPGVGDKTARDLIAKYGTLDNVYAHLGEIKGALHNKLEAGKESAYLSYQLSTIHRDCDVDICLDECATPQTYSQDVKELFREYEFKSLLGLKIFDEPAEATPLEEADEDTPKVANIETTDIGAVFEDPFKELYVDLQPDLARIYNGTKQCTYKLRIGLLDQNVTDPDDYKELLKRVFLDESHRIIVFDYKYVLHILQDYGITPKAAVDDLALIKYLCDFAPMQDSLSKVCAAYDIPADMSAYGISKIYAEYMGRMAKDDRLQALYENVEKPLTLVLFEMETKGVTVSPDMLDEMKAKYLQVQEDLQNRIYEQCGTTFNINSPSQLGQVLYDTFGITELKNKKTGKFSTKAETLEKYRDQYPVVQDVLDYRFYAKLISTYLDGLKDYATRSSDNVVHTSYNQTFTSTGRLSSSGPNLQNIPVRDEEGREIRRAFIPRQGRVFVNADYSQIELRLLAHCSGCKELIDAYNHGEDIHRLTASQVFGVPLEQVTKDMRSHAKAVNFGIIYGISEYGLSKQINVSVGDAHRYIEKYFETYSAVKDYMDSNVAFAKEHGYVETLTGRKRAIPELQSGNYTMRQFGERAAMNMPLQGTSADIIKIAMNNVSAGLKAAGCRADLILQVHDELVLEADEDVADKAAAILKDGMENAMSLKVPLTVEVHMGKDWFALK